MSQGAWSWGVEDSEGALPWLVSLEPHAVDRCGGQNWLRAFPAYEVVLFVKFQILSSRRRWRLPKVR